MVAELILIIRSWQIETPYPHCWSFLGFQETKLPSTDTMTWMTESLLRLKWTKSTFVRRSSNSYEASHELLTVREQPRSLQTTPTQTCHFFLVLWPNKHGASKCCGSLSARMNKLYMYVHVTDDMSTWSQEIYAQIIKTHTWIQMHVLLIKWTGVSVDW